MPTESKKWKCKHCDEEYGKLEQAEKCERSHGGLLRLVEKIKPGELVKIDKIDDGIVEAFGQVEKVGVKWTGRNRCQLSLWLSVYGFSRIGHMVKSDWICESRKYAEQKMITMLMRIFPLAEFSLIASVKNLPGGRKLDVYIKMFTQQELRWLSANLSNQIKQRKYSLGKIYKHLNRPLK